MQDFKRQAFDLRNRIIEALARKNQKEIVIVSAVYKGGTCYLMLQVDGDWRIQPPGEGYVIRCEPDSSLLLEKFTKLADHNFNITVGDRDFYDKVETYEKKVVEYIEKNQSYLSAIFLQALQVALKKVS